MLFLVIPRAQWYSGTQSLDFHLQKPIDEFDQARQRVSNARRPWRDLGLISALSRPMPQTPTTELREALPPVKLGVAEGAATQTHRGYREAGSSARGPP